MELHFLGTGAADWTKKSVHGEFRSFTSTLIDEDLLIDINPSAYQRIANPDRIQTVLFTHSHSDHFHPETLCRLAPCRVYAHISWAHAIQGEGLTVLPIQTGVPFALLDGTRILPLRANHTTARPEETALHYIIERQGKSLLYALDGAWLFRETYQLLRHHTFDAAVFDATIGDGFEDYRIFEHNSIGMVRMMTEVLRKEGRLRPNAPVYLSHLARTLHADQKTLEAQCGDGLIPCFDGMKAVVP